MYFDRRPRLWPNDNAEHLKGHYCRFNTGVRAIAGLWSSKSRAAGGSDRRTKRGGQNNSELGALAQAGCTLVPWDRRSLGCGGVESEDDPRCRLVCLSHVFFEWLL